MLRGPSAQEVKAPKQRLPDGGAAGKAGPPPLAEDDDLLIKAHALALDPPPYPPGGEAAWDEVAPCRASDAGSPQRELGEAAPAAQDVAPCAAAEEPGQLDSGGGLEASQPQPQPQPQEPEPQELEPAGSSQGGHCRGRSATATPFPISLEEGAGEEESCESSGGAEEGAFEDGPAAEAEEEEAAFPPPERAALLPLAEPEAALLVRWAPLLSRLADALGRHCWALVGAGTPLAPAQVPEGQRGWMVLPRRPRSAAWMTRRSRAPSSPRCTRCAAWPSTTRSCWCRTCEWLGRHAASLPLWPLQSERWCSRRPKEHHTTL